MPILIEPEKIQKAFEHLSELQTEHFHLEMQVLEIQQKMDHRLATIWQETEWYKSEDQRKIQRAALVTDLQAELNPLLISIEEVKGEIKAAQTIVDMWKTLVDYATGER